MADNRDSCSMRVRQQDLYRWHSLSLIYFPPEIAPRLFRLLINDGQSYSVFREAGNQF